MPQRTRPGRPSFRDSRRRAAHPWRTHARHPSRPPLVEARGIRSAGGYGDRPQRPRSSDSGSDSTSTTGGRSSKATTTTPTPDTALTAEAPSFTIGLPEEWEQGEANDISELYATHSTEPDVEISVRSSPIADGAEGLEEYVSTQHDTLDGYTNTDEVTDPEALDVEVDGETATFLDWTFTAGNADGDQTKFQHRRVFVVHAGQLYDITFQAPEAGFADLEDDLATMLASWQFA